MKNISRHQKRNCRVTDSPASGRFSGVFGSVGSTSSPPSLALGCRTAEFLLERGFGSEQKVAGLMWGLLAPTPPGRARKPCTGVGSWSAGLLSAILNVPKLRKICRLLWRQIFHSFVTVPPAGALTSPAPPCVGMPPAHSAHTEQRRQAFISRASGAPHQLPWSPSGDTHSSPACAHRTTPSGVHKPRKRRTQPTTLVAVRRHTLQ